MRCKDCSKEMIPDAGGYMCGYCGSLASEPHHDLYYSRDRTGHVVKEYKLLFDCENKLQMDAATIYLDICRDKTLKGVNRRAMLCKCLYQAYAMNGIIKDPIMLGMKFDVVVKDLRKICKIYAQNVQRYDLYEKYQPYFFSATDLLPEFMVAMNIELDATDLLKEAIEQVESGSTIISQIQPRITSVASILWMKQEGGETYDIAEVCREYKIPKATLQKAIKIFTNII